MDPITAATTAAAATAAAVATIVPAAAIVQPPSFDINFEMTRERIGTLPSLHPHPTHRNIRALECYLFEWGYHRLAKQLIKYTLKTNVAWTNAPNPRPHCTLGLSAADTRDAEATYIAEKADYISQLNVTQAIILSLNIAVP